MARKSFYRAEHPKNAREISDYQDLLAKGPDPSGQSGNLGMNADGSNKHQ